MKCPKCGDEIAPVHPVWSFLRFALPCLLLAGLLGFNCKSFDADELKVISQFGIGLAGMMLGTRAIGKISHKDD